MTSCLENIDDWFLKSLQINQCYKDDWEIMKSVFKRYGLNMNQHGPIISINQRKNIKLCDDLTQTLIKLPEFSSYHPKELFIVLLRSFPIYTRNIGYRPFRDWVFNLNSGVLQDLLAIEGTLKKTDDKYERMISKSIRRGKIKINIKL